MNEKEVLLPISSHHCRTTHSACDCVQRLKKLEAVFAVAGPVCMCGVEKMRTEILALRVVEQAARQMYLQYTDVEGIPFRTFEELWRGIGRALAALEEKP